MGPLAKIIISQFILKLFSFSLLKGLNIIKWANINGAFSQNNISQFILKLFSFQVGGALARAIMATKVLWE